MFFCWSVPLAAWLPLQLSCAHCLTLAGTYVSMAEECCSSWQTMLLLCSVLMGIGMPCRAAPAGMNS